MAKGVPCIYVLLKIHSHPIQSMKSKFLVLYPNPENLDLIIKKANLQHAKNGPFLAVVLLGSCLPAEMSSTRPDAPTYFFGKSEKDGNFIDIGPNFTCVKNQYVLLKLESGITLAFFNDTLSSESALDATARADVLVSFDWPYCIAASQRLTLVGNNNVDRIVKQLQPRYHFAAGSEMGKNHEHKVVAWSSKRSYRFISLAREGTGNKWFYAFGIDTGDDDNMAISEDNPFSVGSAKRTRDAESEDALTTAKHQRLDPKRVKVVAPSECFFCLSNPKLESHMIVSIDEFSYLTIAKGPLTSPSRCLDFSGHAIIIPIEHSPTMPAAKEPKEEIEKFKHSLADAFNGQGFDVVFYEISRPENVHFHIQMVPVPKGLVPKMFKRALDEKARINNETFDQNTKLHFKKYSAADEHILDGDRYIQFTVYEGSTKSYYVTGLEEGKTVDLQFPRRVLAFLLRLPKRVNWDRCKQTTVQETSECQKFKSFYEKFDFTKE